MNFGGTAVRREKIKKIKQWLGGGLGVGRVVIFRNFGGGKGF